MGSKKWDNQSLLIRNWGVGLSLCIFLFSSIAPTILGVTWFNPVFSFPIGFLSFIVTVYLMRKYPTMMIRVIRFDFREVETIERNFRLVFRDNGIRYHRTLKEELYMYEFLGHNLTLTLEPHFMHDLEDMVNAKPATSIKIQTVTERNRPFAEKLAYLIDEMVSKNQ